MADTSLENKNVTIDIFSSINQKIRELPTVGWIRQAESYGTTSIQNRMKEENPDLFDKGSINNIEFARVLLDGQSLEDETSFAGIVNGTNLSF